mmetsp:Transcript_8732/g.23570  ORF Transcript_8732/g.23570 Transcript_8732/m.23570 type:complete len:295 (-) Transcript_8732:195-1079(-)
MMRRVPLGALHSQYLHLIAECDGHPIRLAGAPLQVVDLPVRAIRQDGIIDGTLGHGRQIPYQRLRVIPGRADVTRRMRCPSRRIHGPQMPAQFCHGHGRYPNVQDGRPPRFRREGGQVVRILLVPFQTQQRFQIRTLVNDGAVRQTSEIEHAHGPVGTHGCEDVLAPRERQIEYLSIVRYELRPRRLRREIPYRAGGVDAGGSDHVGIRVVPIKRSQRRAVLARLVVVEQGLLLHGARPSARVVIMHAPHPQVIPRRCKQVRCSDPHVRAPHQLRAWIRMIKLRRLVQAPLIIR